uniref:Alcohol acetyltransferase ATF(B)6 n=1 Tax=Saccharomycopsis fibuligera TaxID=4944 RepID=A0A8F2EJV9_SACFI|nr:alcohol acetyltransferase ATF(B)6 [Saccharomycopsis fibuligera]
MSATTNNASADAILKPETIQKCQSPPPSVSKDAYCFDLKFPGDIFYYANKMDLFENFQIAVKLAKPVSKSELFTALQKLLFKFPLLASTVYNGEDETVKPRTIGPRSVIYFENVYEHRKESFGTNPFFDRGLLKELGARTFSFDAESGNALFKVFYFEEAQYLSLMVDHTLFDAGTVLIYVKQLIENINYVTPDEIALTDSLFKDAEKDNSKLKLFDFDRDTKSLEVRKQGCWLDFFDIAPKESSTATVLGVVKFLLGVPIIGSGLKLLVSKKAEKEMFADPSLVTFDQSKKWISRKTVGKHSGTAAYDLALINIPTETLNKVLFFCREHKTTLNTLLKFLYVMSINKVAPHVCAKKFVKVNTIVDLRRLAGDAVLYSTYLTDKAKANETKIYEGINVIFTSYYIEPLRKFSWDLIKKYKDYFHKSIQGSALAAAAYKMYTFVDGIKLINLLYGLKRQTFLLSSNLGFVHVKKYSDDNASHQNDIKDLIFMSVPGAVYGECGLTSVSTTEGGLNLFVMVSEEETKENFVAFLNTFEKSIYEVAETGKFEYSLDSEIN